MATTLLGSVSQAIGLVQRLALSGAWRCAAIVL